MQLSIIPHPHPTLRTRSKPIRRVDRDLRAIVDQMLDLMYEANGVGLAANQVDLPIRLFVVNPAGERGDGEELILINPELQRPKGNETAQEGCLSLPGLYGQVKRPKSIRLSAFDLKGNPIERTVDGFLARILQHENDHLDGVMFYDRMSDEGRRDLEDGLAELETDFRSKQQSGGIPSDEELVKRLTPWYEKYT
ncbi:Peptide deformylase [Rubripirellula lacrimiformis]|uniref:Peptide deformylase n=1 Tax=Rubripirellula lacrimiformis TaxID=1930273 RepID=A0A517NB79_9BACT|nr:peptide deformylase [Rubripirellula lacrimiformis]QDT04392.1 Peptide deformylase [Rubripirellula lacrimiformis]